MAVNRNVSRRACSDSDPCGNDVRASDPARKIQVIDEIRLIHRPARTGLYATNVQLIHHAVLRDVAGQKQDVGISFGHTIDAAHSSQNPLAIWQRRESKESKGSASNGTYLSRKVVSDALRHWYLLSPRRRPGPNFRRITAQTTFDPGLRRGDNLEIGARNQFGVQSS